MNKANITQAIDYNDAEMKNYEGAWDTNDGLTKNYLRGFKEITFNLSTLRRYAIKGDLIISPEYWID